MPLYRTDETYTTSESVSWTKGAHVLRFGFDMVRHHLNHWQPELSHGRTARLLRFQRLVTTTLKCGNAPPTNQFNAYAQFLLGLSDDAKGRAVYSDDRP